MELTVVSVVVLQTGLEKNFAEVQVSLVECPDLTQEPFNFPVKGGRLSAYCTGYFLKKQNKKQKHLHRIMIRI